MVIEVKCGSKKFIQKLTLMCYVYNLYFYLLWTQGWGFVTTILIFLISQINLRRKIKPVQIDKIREIDPALFIVVLVIPGMFWAKSYSTEYE